MDLDIEITAIRRKSDKKTFAVGDQLPYGNETICGFEIAEKQGKIEIFVSTKTQSSINVWKTPLEQF